jgi:hypothetical protein
MSAALKEIPMAKALPRVRTDLSLHVSLVGGPKRAPMVGRRLRTLAAPSYSASLSLTRSSRICAKVA